MDEYNFTGNAANDLIRARNCIDNAYKSFSDHNCDEGKIKKFQYKFIDCSYFTNEWAVI